MFDGTDPIGFRFQRISWPKACIGCGIQSESELRGGFHAIERETQTKKSGSFIDTVYHQSLNVDAHLYLCSSCELFAKSEQRALRVKNLVGALTSLIITLTLAYILNITGLNPSITNFLFLLVVLSAPFGLKIIQLSRYFSALSPFHSFYDVSFFLQRGSLEFRSERYYEVFKKLNPDSDILTNHNDRIRLTSGSEDQGTDMAFGCLIGPGLCGLVLMTVLMLLGGFQDLAFLMPVGSVVLIFVLTYLIEAGFFRAFGVSEKSR
ncbi:MAG: hypothetical protein ACXADC_05755 [Candidatus Thorarchaeota archaeon]